MVQAVTAPIRYNIPMDRMIIGAWVTEDELEDLCSDLEVNYQEALDRIRESDLQSSLNEHIINVVWGTIKENHD